MQSTIRCGAAALLIALAACSDGSDGAPGPPGEPSTPTALGPGDAAPGVSVVVVSVAGASGPSGAFLPGDRAAVRFRLEKDDGTAWQLAEMASGEALCSGPTKNYQRVLPLAGDVLAASVDHGDGSYTYRFAPLPAVFAPPYNDSPAFGVDHGELTGLPLLEGTYTLGLSFAWAYTAMGEQHLDVGEVALDVLLGGGAGPLAPRRVTQAENCDRCHVDLTAHDGRYKTLVLCLACHTSGAEDRNDPELGDGTPGVTIDSRVLFHRIHNGAHLPSVIGIEVQGSGALDYDAAPKPFVVAGSDGELHDYSEVGFPAWPNRTEPMPLAPLYDTLSDAAKVKEDRVRTGVTSCYLCHHDPDGDGPIEAPADGELIYAQLTRKACGACHDDVVWDQPYQGDLGLMDPQLSDADCQECHAADVDPMGTIAAHLHPLRDPAFDDGTLVLLLDVHEAGVTDGDGTFDPGEKIEVVLAFANAAGTPLAPAAFDEVRVTLSGPAENPNLVHSATFPSELLTGPGPLVLRVPAVRRLEYLGDASAALDVFQTSGAPHYAVPSAPTTIRVRTGLGGGASATVAPAVRGQNYLDVASAASFQHGDVVVVADGLPGEEYLEVQLALEGRLWFSSPDLPDVKPALENDHAAGTSVLAVVLAPLAAGVDYALDAGTGSVSELVELGTGAAVLADYATDFVVPQTFPPPANDSPDLGAELGEWSGAALPDGTYVLSAWGSRTKNYSFFGITSTPYRLISEAQTAEVLLGDALTPAPHAGIEDPAACNACHQDLRFHDSARGYPACLACHGNAGPEDLARYVAAGAPETPGARVDLRWMVHRIHHARLLPDPDAFVLVSEGDGPYPDNFEVETFASILFPAQPGATRACAKCHGEANEVWKAPPPRTHPTADLPPVLAWTASCSGCHASAAEIAHMQAQTAPDGTESCFVCHAPGEELSVENVHRPR